MAVAAAISDCLENVLDEKPGLTHNQHGPGVSSKSSDSTERQEEELQRLCFPACYFCKGAVTKSKSATFCCKVCQETYRVVCRDEHSANNYPLKTLANPQDWGYYKEVLKERAAPGYLFTKYKTRPVKNVEAGMKLEALDRSNPSNYCVATIIEIVGHRLRIRYDGFGDMSAYDFWTNFQAEELFQIGWCAGYGYPLQPPTGISCYLLDWKAFLTQTLTGALAAPSELFREVEFRRTLRCHSFQTGNRVEVIHPKQPSIIVSAVVSKSLGPYYFMVTIEQLPGIPSYSFYGFEDCPGLYEQGYCEKYGLHVIVPSAVNSGSQAMSDLEQGPTPSALEMYKRVSASAPPQYREKKSKAPAFRIGHKVEVVDLCEPANIVVATVSGLFGHIVLFTLDGSGKRQFMDKDSEDIFPFGHCESAETSLGTAFGPVLFQAKHGNIGAMVQVSPYRVCSLVKAALFPDFKKSESGTSAEAGSRSAIQRGESARLSGSETLSSSLSADHPENPPPLELANSNDRRTVDPDEGEEVSPMKEDGESNMPAPDIKIYFSRTCYAGALLDPEKVAQIKDCTPSDRPAQALKYLIEILVEVAISKESLLETIESGFGSRIFNKNKEKVVKKALFRFNTLKKVGRFVRRLMRQLQCCEHFASLDKESRCPGDCKEKARFFVSSSISADVSPGKKKVARLRMDCAGDGKPVLVDGFSHSAGQTVRLPKSSNKQLVAIAPQTTPTPLLTTSHLQASARLASPSAVSPFRPGMINSLTNSPVAVLNPQTASVINKLPVAGNFQLFYQISPTGTASSPMQPPKLFVQPPSAPVAVPASLCGGSPVVVPQQAGSSVSTFVIVSKDGVVADPAAAAVVTLTGAVDGGVFTQDSFHSFPADHLKGNYQFTALDVPSSNKHGDALSLVSSDAQQDLGQSVVDATTRVMTVISPDSTSLVSPSSPSSSSQSSGGNPFGSAVFVADAVPPFCSSGPIIRDQPGTGSSPQSVIAKPPPPPYHALRHDPIKIEDGVAQADPVDNPRHGSHQADSQHVHMQKHGNARVKYVEFKPSRERSLPSTPYYAPPSSGHQTHAMLQPHITLSPRSRLSSMNCYYPPVGPTHQSELRPPPQVHLPLNSQHHLSINTIARSPLSPLHSPPALRPAGTPQPRNVALHSPPTLLSAAEVVRPRFEYDKGSHSPGRPAPMYAHMQHVPTYPGFHQPMHRSMYEIPPDGHIVLSSPNFVTGGVGKEDGNNAFLFNQLQHADVEPVVSPRSGTVSSVSQRQHQVAVQVVSCCDAVLQVTSSISVNGTGVASPGMSSAPPAITYLPMQAVAKDKVVYVPVSTLQAGQRFLMKESRPPFMLYQQGPHLNPSSRAIHPQSIIVRQSAWIGGSGPQATVPFSGPRTSHSVGPVRLQRSSPANGEALAKSAGLLPKLSKHHLGSHGNQVDTMSAHVKEANSRERIFRSFASGDHVMLGEHRHMLGQRNPLHSPQLLKLKSLADGRFPNSDMSSGQKSGDASLQLEPGESGDVDGFVMSTESVSQYNRSSTGLKRTHSPGKRDTTENVRTKWEHTAKYNSQTAHVNYHGSVQGQETSSTSWSKLKPMSATGITSTLLNRALTETYVKNERQLLQKGVSYLQDPLPGLSLPANPELWTSEDLCKFLSATDCKSCIEVIKEQEIDGKSFLLITREALMEFLGLRLGPALKLSGYAAQLRAKVRMCNVSVSAPPPPKKKRRLRAKKDGQSTPVPRDEKPCLDDLNSSETTVASVILKAESLDNTSTIKGAPSDMDTSDLSRNPVSHIGSSEICDNSGVFENFCSTSTKEPELSGSPNVAASDEKENKAPLIHPANKMQMTPLLDEKPETCSRVQSSGERADPVSVSAVSDVKEVDTLGSDSAVSEAETGAAILVL